MRGGMGGPAVMVFLGIDGGKKGAIALLSPPSSGFSEVDISPMPIICATTGKGKDEYDVAGIAELFRTWDGIAAMHGLKLFAVVEKPMPLPPHFRTKGGGTIPSGGLAQFNRGVQLGFAWMLEALRIPYQLVAARTWQKVMLEGTPGEDTKQRSVMAAQRLFPGVDLKRSPRCRKADDGFSDALLLAEYARRIKNGGSRNG